MARAKSAQVVVGSVAEDDLVARLLSGWRPASGVHLGPGDDCAVIKRPGAKLLLKVDALHEGIHFLRQHPAEAVGWKALARPLSDIAAMAGIPQYAMVSLAAPCDLPLSYLDGIYAGLGRAARSHGVTLVGGETSRSPAGLFLSVTLVGEVGREGILTRAGACDRDAIWVTGRLGGSYASGRHLRFRPRLAEARWLAAEVRPSAMMDLSDGLGADLPRLARCSGLGFVIEEKRIPRSRGCSLAQAIGDGEDYELLFTLPPGRSRKLEELLPQWKKLFPRVPLSRIGWMKAGGGRVLSVPGFQHFGD